MAPEQITPEQRALDGIRQREEVVFHLMADKRAEADAYQKRADLADAYADDYALELAGLNTIRELLARVTAEECDLCGGPCTYKSPRSDT